MKIFFASHDPVSPSDEAKERWLYVINCGYYRDVIENMRTVRKAGRSDYHLLYVKSGAMSVNGETLTDGYFRIYAPREAQDYTYIAAEKSNYFWAHFTGTAVLGIFEELGLGSGIFNFNDRAEEIEKVWLLLCESMFFKRGNLDNYSASLLMALLNLLATPKTTRSPFSSAAKILEDINTKVTVPELAQKYHMSVGHFIESFKEIYGYSPMNYRAMKQFEQAKIFLKETDISITAISELCGFNDPLYFSRQFKKHVGVCPTHYRSKFREHSGDR